MVYSGLQKDVLHLYRSLLRTAIKKADGNKTVRKALLSVVQRRFREESSSVKRHDFQTIEYLIRFGHKQRKLMEMPGFSTAKIASVEHTNTATSA